MGLRLAQAGTVELRVETDGALGPDVYFDDVRVDYTTSTIVQEQHTYAYGAPLRGLNYVIGPTRYRHGYQGQFAEIDPETGTDDFELRLYDSRIGRWTAPDPAGQYHSPYVGLGNNPVSSVDPDGGFAEWLGSFLSGIGIGHLVESAGVAATYYGPSLAQIGSVSLQVGLGAASASVQAAQGGKSPTQPKNANNDVGTGGNEPNQAPKAPKLKTLTPDDIETIKEKWGWDHKDKPGGSKQDLYKDKKGNVYQDRKLKRGPSNPEEIGINLWDGHYTPDYHTTILKPAGQATVVVGTGVILWEVIKWGGAILAAPETGGASLVPILLIP